MKENIKIRIYKKIYNIFSYFDFLINKETYINPKYLSKSVQKKKIIFYYTIEKILQTKRLCLSSIFKITEREINNFIFINKGTQIELSPSAIEKSLNYSDEIEYFQALSKIFRILETHNRSYDIKIYVQNRELLKQSKILEYCSNINLTIYSDFHNYTIEEYLVEEKQLEKFVISIKESNLSPYEKFLAVYNIVKQFKPYNDHKKDTQAPRRLRNILNNEYIVCVGYAVLLENLLNKVGIPVIVISTSIDTSYEDGFTQECIPTNRNGHSRNIVRIYDDKYNIHGIFVADATWDNTMKYDLYNNAAITFDKKKEAYQLETLTQEDLLLDFHNFEEFNTKINHFLKRKIKETYGQTPEEKIIDGYRKVYDAIMGILIKLDYEKYKELSNKYAKKVEDIMYKRVTSTKEIEKTYSDFLTEYATYIIPLSNEKVKDTVLYQAASTVKKVVDNFTKEELKQWNRETKKINQIAHSIYFPYSYNPKDPRPNYLKTRGKIRIKTKNTH